MGSIMLLASPVLDAACPDGDVDGDCQVNITDLRLMALQWMGLGSANLDGLGDVNYSDFAILAGDWREDGNTTSVTVNIAGTIPTGGQWRIDSGPWYNSGDTASGIPLGSYTVTFAEVAGYDKPADEPFDVTPGGTPTTETLVTMSSSVWEYLYDGSDQGTAWQAYGFGDGWDSGPGQLGFGDGDEATDIGPRVIGQITAYFRHKFTVLNKSEITDLEIDLLYDDGAVVHLNEQEVDRFNMPGGTIVYDTEAENASVDNRTATFSADVGDLNEGDNILAVEVHQANSGSSDLSFDLNLEASRITGSPEAIVINAGAYTLYTGSVTVNISGTVPTGGQWQVNGGSWNDSGDTESGITVGAHTVTFADVAGYDKPADEPVTVTHGGTAVVNAGAYVLQTGTLVVNISPQGAINDGAQWRVDGGVWRDSGDEIVQSVGTHTVDFSSAFGWQKPSSEQVDVYDSTQTVLSRSYSPAPTAGVQINEFMSDNDSRSPLESGEILDGDLMSSDWIELYNNSGSSVDISGWYLTDEDDQPTKWQLPSGMSALDPGGYLIVFASGKTEEENPGNYPYSDGTYYHTNFKLDRGGEYLALIGSDGTTIVHEYNQYPDQEENISYGLDGSDPSYFSVATPGAANTGAFAAFVKKPEVNIEGGCYETTIDVTLSCDTVGADIYYTTDGSDPTPGTGTLYTGPIQINSLTALIAKGYRTDFHPSKARIETYIFLQSGISPSNTNLPMVIVDTLGQTIPNAKDQPPEVQYTDCRIVIIDVDEVTGRAEITGPEHFAGIGQIKRRGESTYGQGHYGLEIQDEYGLDKDVSLLGMPAESDWVLSYDVIDYSMMKCEIAFKWFRDMGHRGCQQRYVELYLNTGGGAISSSDYDGLFMLRERIKRSNNRVDIARMDLLHNAEPQVTGGYIMKSDKRDPGDIVMHEQDLWDDGYPIGAGAGMGIIADPDWTVITDQQIDWIIEYLNEVHSVFWQDTGSPYYPGPGAKDSDYVDEVSWIDHGIVEQIGNDADAFWGSYFVHKDRNGKVFSGPAWDFDRAFHNNGGSSRGYTGWRTQGEIFGKWHQMLQEDLEYKMKLADRWFEHRETVTNTAQTLAYVDEVIALITEARSRPKKSYPRTFEAENTLFKDWITNRLDWLDDEIASRFAEAPPIFSPVGGYISSGSSVSMTKPPGVSGTIYYTTNGEDPRLEGGAINPNASSGGSVTLNKSTCLKARVKDGSDWTAMNTEVYGIGPVLDNLRITELMYHPTEPTAGELAALNPDPIDEDFEFIEVKNIGGTAINLNLVHFTDGIDFTCGDYTLAAGAYAVIVKNQAAFAERYGTGMNIVPGSYVGYLSNNGEEIVLRDAIGAEIHDFDYEDNWFELTDGYGYSLTLVDPTNPDLTVWDTKFGWRSSLNVNGTPGQAPETVLAADSIVINELLAHSHAAAPDWIELHNTTGSPIDISGWFLSDDDSSDINIRKYEFQPGSIVPAGGYLSLEQDVTFGNPTADGCNIAFGLSEGGETVYLYSGAGGAVTGYYQTQQKFDASETGVTLGRYEKAELSGGYDFVRQISPSQDAVNSGPLVPDVVITEIYYNPPSGVDYEFVELYNRSGSSVTLESTVTTETSPGVFITEDIPWRIEGTGYEFSAGVTIPAYTRILVAKTPANYSSAPCTVYGPYDGKLDNGGEQIELQIPGDQEYGEDRYQIPIEKVDYDDVAPWPTSADGGGDSLNRDNISTYSRDYSNWSAAAPTAGY